jgi:hypothetical protein
MDVFAIAQSPLLKMEPLILLQSAILLAVMVKNSLVALHANHQIGITNQAILMKALPTQQTESESLGHRTVMALRRIEKGWPKGMMLFANNGNLHLMQGHPEDGGKSIATFAIPSDGGDTFIG